MAKWFTSEVFDDGLNYVIGLATTSAVEVVVLKAYSSGDSYATVNGNVIAAIAIDETDLTLGDYSTIGRQIAVDSQEVVATADSDPAPDLHIALRDTTLTKVLAVTDETSDREIFTDDPITIPALVFALTQPPT